MDHQLQAEMAARGGAGPLQLESRLKFEGAARKRERLLANERDKLKAKIEEEVKKGEGGDKHSVWDDCHEWLCNERTIEDLGRAKAWPRSESGQREEPLRKKLRKIDAIKKPRQLCEVMSDLARAHPWPAAVAERVEEIWDVLLTRIIREQQGS